MLYKTSKIVFSRFIFTIYYTGIQDVTRGYRGLQGVTRVTGGFKGLQGITRGYRGLQRVTGGYKGLYKLFFQLERSQVLFLGTFCIKIKVEKTSNFCPKR